ncbi:MAG: heme biosynthesis protein HemY [Tissierellia bacterium]|jgi:Fe-S cluster assembly iron-binding protein IscA|nr:heme biosynthesis protein HemY [Bacillota bacterium]NLL22810.1 heme biosynthesis protein HemY [Tissierellia bacterium]
MLINTTKETVDEIKKVIEEYPEEGSCVRIFLAGMGCSGPAFGLALDERGEKDLYYESEGQGFVMESSFYEEYGDFNIEYADGGYIVRPVNAPAAFNGCASCAGGCN